MNTELYFSQIIRNETGVRTSETTVLEALSIEWDNARRRFKAIDQDGRTPGYGKTHSEAVLDYLGKRLGLIEVKPVAKVTYSRRIF